MDGFKTENINSQERAVSTDINNLQKFVHADIAEFLRYFFNTEPTADDDLAGEAMVVPNTATAPLSALVINGLCVLPQTGVGVVDLQVQPGMVVLMDPDSVVNESNLKFVNDAGVTSNGVLQITPNPSGSIRIDVVEVELASLETFQNRDIFNTASGLFNATSVLKVIAGKLNYRVRAGTAGSGYPAAVAGWLPLAVISLPAAAVDCDDCTFWDVRPLARDRAYQGNAQLKYAFQTRANGQRTATSDIQAGVVECIYKNWRVGGVLRSGIPGSDTAPDALDLTDHLSPNSTWPNSIDLAHLYFMFPFGLPRWARYTATAPRLPRGPKGIPVLSSFPPAQDGTPSSALSFPTVCGFAGATSQLGTLAYITTHDNGAGAGLESEACIIANNKVHARHAPSQAPTASTTTSYTYTIPNNNTKFPASAKKLWIRIAVAMTAAADKTPEPTALLQATFGTGAVAYNVLSPGYLVTGSYTVNFNFEIDLGSLTPQTNPTNLVIVFNHSFNIAGITLSSALLNVEAWEI